MGSNERHKLVGRDQKCECVNETEQPQDEKTSEPLGIPAREKSLERIRWIAH